MIDIDARVEQYASDQTTDTSSYIAKLVETSDQELQHIDMLSGKVVGQLLAMLVRVSGASRILEIGTFTGFSALYMAEALPDDGQLITCEYNERYKAIAEEAFTNHPEGHKIELRMGPALETISTLTESFDFIYLDADKINYLNYYKKLIPILQPGCLMVIDNVLWNGEVIEPEAEKPKAIAELNNFITQDKRVEQVMLTVRDGVTIVRKL